MTRLEPVVWTKGTFLSPQHLQHQDRFLESLLRFQSESLAFCPWGFRALEISRAALSAGTLEISRASGIFRDGLRFDIPGSDRAPDPKPLADCFTQERDTVEIHLAVPQFRDRGRNVASRDGDARYRAEVEVFVDENTGTSERPVQVARKNFRLLTEDDSAAGCTTLRVARICRTPAGTFELVPNFVPPLLDFWANEYLLGIARRLVEVLAARSTTLADVRRQKNQSLADFTIADIAGFWLLYTVNTAFPVLNHLFQTRGGHPENLFASMLELAGALTAFSFDTHPRDLPLYEHDNLGGCFAALDEKISTLLETVIPANFATLPLKLIQNSIYAVSIEDDKYFANARMYLAITAEAPQADIVARVPQLVKVCCANQIEHLIRQALPGMSLTYVPSPPRAVPVKLNYQYFSLGQHGTAWEAILRARTLAAYVPADLPDPQLELLILLPQTPTVEG